MAGRRQVEKRIKSRKSWLKPVHRSKIDFLEYYDEEELKGIVSQLISLYEYSRDWRQSYKTKWTEEYLLYRAISGYYQDKQKWQSKYFLAEVYRIIESMLPEWVGAFFDTPPLFKSLPNGDKMVKSGRITELLLQKRVNQTVYFLTMYYTLKSAAMYGAGIQKLLYEYSPNYEGPMPMALDIFDYYGDPRYCDPKDMLFQIHRSLEHRYELERMEKMELYKNVGELNKETSGYEPTSMDRLRVLGYAGSADQNDKMDDFHETLEFHVKWKDFKTGEMFDAIAVLADRKTLLRFEETPYMVRPPGAEFYYGLKPFYIFKQIHMQGELYGMSTTETIKSGQLSINDLENARGDAMQFMQYPVYEVFKPGLEKNRLFWGPGAVIEKNVPSPVVTPLQQDYNMLFASDTMIKEKQDQMKQIAGTQDTFLGQEGRIRKTATEAMYLGSRAQSRLKLPAQIAALTEMPRMARDMYILDHEFTGEDVLAEIFDSKQVKAWKKINPKKIVYEGDFEIHVSSTFGHKEKKLEDIYELLKIGAEVEPIGSRLKYDKLAREIAILNELDPEDVIVSDEEIVKKTAMPSTPEMPAMPSMPATTPVTGQEINALAPTMESQGLSPGVTDKIKSMVSLT